MRQGFNHNILHNGKVFHVQTEDSGSYSQQINTLLFLDGHIIASKNLSYREMLEEKQGDVDVRALMVKQHKTMLLELKAGTYETIHLQELKPSSRDDNPASAALSREELAPNTEEQESLPFYAREEVFSPDYHNHLQLAASSSEWKAANYSNLRAMEADSEVTRENTQDLVPFAMDTAPALETSPFLEEVEPPSQRPMPSIEIDILLDAPEELLPSLASHELPAVAAYTDEAVDDPQRWLTLLEVMAADDASRAKDCVARLMRGENRQSFWWLEALCAPMVLT